MKKLVAALLAVLMILGVFVGCGAKETPAPEKPAPTEDAVKPEKTEEPETTEKKAL